jgi:hypothetical protein
MCSQAQCVTSLVIGDTGAGKSEFGNRYVGASLFEANDGPMPVTAAPSSNSRVVDGMTRRVIDTEGHADGNSVSSIQIQKLASFFRTWQYGVNGICVVLNGQNDRFSQGIKDTLRWAYNTFGTQDVLTHICIVFTRCYDAVPYPNRERKQTEYRACVRTFLQEISGVSSAPEIPIFFVDSIDMESMKTKQNMTQFHGWLVSRTPLPTDRVQAVALRDNVEEEYQRRILTRYRYQGPPSDQYQYAVYQDKKRQKLTPYNGDSVRYGEWEVTREWEEYAGHQKIETRSRNRETEDKMVDHHSGHSMSGFSRRDHTHYTIRRNTWTEQWTVTTHFDGTVTETSPVRVGSVSTRTIDSDRERGWTDGYQGRSIH